MKFRFSIEKAVAAVSFLSELNGRHLDMIRTLKALVVADKEMLLETHRTITGDRVVAMKLGPVPSAVYDLAKNRRPGTKEQEIWDSHFSQMDGYGFDVRKTSDISILSDLEMDALKEANAVVNSFGTVSELSDWLHRHYPGWTDPGESSKEIDPREILLTRYSEAEVAKIEADLEARDLIRSKLDKLEQVER